MPAKIEGISPRQRDLLQFILRFEMRYRYSPSIHEMMLALEVSSANGIRKHLEQLEAKGYIVRGGIRRIDLTAKALEEVGGNG